ncbi:UNVERIFIED_CONTAM: hypothetical protein FKN15_057649 [Acipenser sinensis]
MNTRCPPKRVPSAARFFTLCRLTVQLPQSFSLGGQRSSGQLTGKPAGARPDYRGRWCAICYGSSAHRHHPCAESGGVKMNTRCPPKRVPSAARFFTLCKLTVQPPQSYSIRGQRSSGQLTGKPAGARPDYRGRWCAIWTAYIHCTANLKHLLHAAFVLVGFADPISDPLSEMDRTLSRRHWQELVQISDAASPETGSPNGLQISTMIVHECTKDS